MSDSDNEANIRDAMAGEREGTASVPVLLPEGVQSLLTSFELECMTELAPHVGGELGEPSVRLVSPGILPDASGLQLQINVKPARQSKTEFAKMGDGSIAIHVDVAQLEALGAAITNVIARAKKLGLLEPSRQEESSS